MAAVAAHLGLGFHQISQERMDGFFCLVQCMECACAPRTICQDIIQPKNKDWLFLSPIKKVISAMLRKVSQALAKQNGTASNTLSTAGNSIVYPLFRRESPSVYNKTASKWL
jgi:hypothetical protein